MKVDQLVPRPVRCETFKRDRLRFIPEVPGCYALTTFGRAVLYIGLTNNLRSRIKAHLDNPAKTGETKRGRAVIVFWMESAEVNKIERTWMNIHLQLEGALPILNSIYSPTST
jgi:hypothetical protein